MTNKEKIINRELSDILDKVLQTKIDFNLCLTTLEARKADISAHILRLKNYIKGDINAL
jgi:hypothetical protein